MTTGNKVIDGTRAVSTNSGPGRVGTYQEKTWSGSDSPKGQKHVVPHPFNTTFQSYYDEVFRYRFTSTGTGYPYTGTVRNMFGNPAFASPWTASDDSYIIGKLVRAIKAYDFNAAVTAAESTQTLAHLTSTANRLSEGFGFLLRGEAQKALVAWGKRPIRIHATSLSGAWLELQYAWRPLIGDTFNAAEALAYHLGVPFAQKYRAGGVRRSSDPMWEGERRMSRNIIAIVTEDIPLMQRSGLLDPELIAWELLPYSFVADWFIPIGDWLETRALISKLRHATFVDSRLDVTNVRGIGNTGIYTQANPSFVYNSGSFNRTVSSVPPSLPLPRFTPLSQLASWSHAVTAVSLVMQRFGRVSSRLSPVFR